ncbi:hypothetical protein ACP275_14G108800 [Erythranthe tilingii]
MSRREDRSSESKRRRSGFDREPSPKKSRDGKPETGPEKDRSDRDFKQHRTLDPKVESAIVSKDSLSTKKYSQHDDRGSVGQNGRSFSRRTDNERGWWRDSKQEQNDRAINETVSKEPQQKAERAKDNNREEIEANPKPPMRKRPSFREQKTPTDAEKAANPNQDHPAESGRRRNERVYSSRYSDKHERSFAGGRELNKAQRVSSRGNFSSGDRYREGGDRFTARQGYNRPSGGRVEKWKHDLYHEANRSPTPKNEDDQISKIEALLGS